MFTKKREPFIHIVKRADMPVWKMWLVRAVAVLVAFLVSGLVCLMLTKGKYFVSFYAEMFDGAFGTERRILNLFQYWAMLLCISLAVTPACK
ncbi:MAG: ABC transporter permease, partial [Clostridia bacterium]|nr:ABC transporter permease [Clostridia bacterium]